MKGEKGDLGVKKEDVGVNQWKSWAKYWDLGVKPGDSEVPNRRFGVKGWIWRGKREIWERKGEIWGQKQEILRYKSSVWD